ncbi:Hypothetical protein A7982_01584 [Minicystis rosea]|nr:Hypothetical protein A7982_01584 [Minicystis rosea]
MSSFFASRARREPAALVFAVVSALVAACGGKVVVDVDGAAGGGLPEPTTGVGASTSSGTAGAGGCDELGAILESAVFAAQTCNPVLSVQQCSGKVVIHDGCGCELAANETKPGAAMAAISAFDTWVAAGCGPVPCLLCPPPPSSEPWFCNPATSQCDVGF